MPALMAPRHSFLLPHPARHRDNSRCKSYYVSRNNRSDNSKRIPEHSLQVGRMLPMLWLLIRAQVLSLGQVLKAVSKASRRL